MPAGIPLTLPRFTLRLSQVDKLSPLYPPYQGDLCVS